MLNLAKNAIRSQFYTAPLPSGPGFPKLKAKRACFVTITIDNQLHGCIGHLLPIQELQNDIIENAKSAAFLDPRFPPLTKEETDQMNIEISILTIPKPFSYKTHEELLAFLGKQKPGVILSKGSFHATFLPAVWDDLPDPVAFLSNLSLKAGLEENAWKYGVKIELYNAEKITL